MSRTDNRLINIKYKDGRVARIPRSTADTIVHEGKAKFISNTAYRKVTRAALKESKKKLAEEQSKKAAERREEKTKG